MTLRVNKSIVAGMTTVSLDIEVSNLDQFIDTKPSLSFEFVEMLIDKVFSDSNGAEIEFTDSETST